MSDSRANARRARSRAMWLVLLGTCTLWLVVQNTVLLVAVMWTEPASVFALAGALAKAAGTVITRLWPLLVALLVVAVPFVLMLRAARVLAHPEVRHG